MRQGVIDIGSNSVKLLIADSVDHQIYPVTEIASQTRLGQGLYKCAQLQPDAIEATSVAVNDFIKLAESEGVEKLRLIATSAVREASNASQLLAMIDQPVSILSGDDEARFSFFGVMTDSRFTQNNLLVVDAGGGSTEFTSGNSGGVARYRSISLGSVRLMESFSVNDPPINDQLEALRNISDVQLRQVVCSDHWKRKSDFHLVGVGGGATILAMMELSIEVFDRKEIEKMTLSREQAVKWSEKLWSLPLAQRKNICGLPANRADVALYGCLIYERIMLGLGYDHLLISTRGVRFGALADNI
ncbi:MAG: hypothetical protein VX961_04735 [Verrucomicrobiota bacterium]|nr:hypothetical protein [Verrucomicrobiota bacterium]